MSELTLISRDPSSIRALIEAAPSGKEKALLTAIYRTEQRLRKFARNAGTDSESLSRRYSAGDIEESLDTIEWVGEIRVLQRLREKLALLRGISIEGA